MFALVLFTAALVTYVSILFGYNPLLNQRLLSLDDEIQKISTTISKEDQKNLADFYSQLVNARNLLRGHVASSNIFTLLERNTNRNVSFSSMKLDADRREFQLEGTARTLEDAIQQAEAFRRMTEAETVTVGSMQVGETGGIRFGMTIRFAGTALSAS